MQSKGEYLKTRWGSNLIDYLVTIESRNQDVEYERKVYTER